MLEHLKLFSQELFLWLRFACLVLKARNTVKDEPENEATYEQMDKTLVML